MKRINITLSDEVVEQVEELARRKEMTVAELTRRSLELYLARFPKNPTGGSKIPVYDLGKIRTSDMKRVIYGGRIKEMLE